MHDIARLWHTASAESRRDSADRAARVLAHEDLRKRLTEPPVSIPDPWKWSGWIPPKTLPEDACGSTVTACGGQKHGPRCDYTQHRSRMNTSPRRRALVEIAAEALRREQRQDALAVDDALVDAETTEDDPWA